MANMQNLPDWFDIYQYKLELYLQNGEDFVDNGS